MKFLNPIITGEELFWAKPVLPVASEELELVEEEKLCFNITPYLNWLSYVNDWGELDRIMTEELQINLSDLMSNVNEDEGAGPLIFAKTNTFPVSTIVWSLDPLTHEVKKLTKQDLQNVKKIYEYDGTPRLSRDLSVNPETDPIIVLSAGYGIITIPTREIIGDTEFFDPSQVITAQEEVVVVRLMLNPWYTQADRELTMRFFISTDNFETAETIDRKITEESSPLLSDFVFTSGKEYQLICTALRDQDLDKEEFKFEYLKENDFRMQSVLENKYYSVIDASVAFEEELVTSIFGEVTLKTMVPHILRYNADLETAEYLSQINTDSYNPE